MELYPYFHIAPKLLEAAQRAEELARPQFREIESIQRYNQQKMLAARQFLQTTDLPVSHIAVRLGYSNFSHFSSAYKKQFGITPNEEKRMSSPGEI